MRNLGALAFLSGAVFALVTTSVTTAQSPETFKTRLAPVALDAAMKNVIAGSGTASAVLTGTKLTVSGTFDGLKSNATMAHIHQGTATGVRGDKVLDLAVTHAMMGTLSGTGAELLADDRVRQAYLGM